jgi:DNA-binding MltR family transcriptional regulator
MMVNFDLRSTRVSSTALSFLVTMVSIFQSPILVFLSTIYRKNQWGCLKSAEYSDLKDSKKSKKRLMPACVKAI